MILSYDSVLGIPIVESSGENTNNNNNMGINLGVPSLLLLAVIIILFATLFSTLGKKEGSSESTSNGSGKILTVLLGGVVIAVILLNGLQYFDSFKPASQLA